MKQKLYYIKNETADVIFHIEYKLRQPRTLITP